MASNAIHEMIAAYSAGCMDKKNLVNFRDYIESGGEMPVGELGELQNVISLLPVILELEKPSPALKDKVAKKLIGMQDEIKEKIKLTKQTAATKTRTVVPPREEFEEEESPPPATSTSAFDKIEPLDEKEDTSYDSESEKEETRVTSFDTTPPPPRSRTRTKTYESIKPGSQPPPPTQSYELPPRSVDDLPQKEGGKLKFLWIALGLVFAILLGGLIIVYSSIDYDSKISALEQRIENLQSQVDQNQQQIAKYEELNQFMNYEDLQVISLSPINENSQSSGKLMISFENNEGLLELRNMPSIDASQAFQVWLISEGRSFSLGTYVPTRNEKYLKIDNVPFIPRNEIEMVRVTIEPLSGSDLPQGNAVLFGTVNGS